MRVDAERHKSVRDRVLVYEMKPAGERRLFEVVAVDTDQGWVEEAKRNSEGILIRGNDGRVIRFKRFGKFILRDALTHDLLSEVPPQVCLCSPTENPHPACPWHGFGHA